MPVQEAMRLLQAVGEHEWFVREQRSRGTFGDQFAIVEDDNPGTEIDDQFEVMRRDDLRSRERLKQGFELPPATRVEVAAGLIEHQDCRFAGQNPGQADSAFFAVA